MLPKFCHTQGGRVSLVYFTTQADEKNPLFSADSETTLTADHSCAVSKDCQHHSSKKTTFLIVLSEYCVTNRDFFPQAD